MSSISPNLGLMYGQLGNLYSEVGHFSKAKEYNETAIHYMEITGIEPSIIANAWHNLGNSYQQLNLIEMAVNCYL
jgi:tetratricopeptide (TPR) repeat protein